jgi:hypothetical protein
MTFLISMGQCKQAILSTGHAEFACPKVIEGFQHPFTL